MPTSTLIRWSAPLFALGGICFALFIFIANGEFVGAELGLSTRHHVAHTVHFYSALFFLFGITGFYAAHRVATGFFGLVAFLVAMVGTALFCATGVITAFVWRTISAHAPQLVESHGAFFEPPLPVIFIATVVFSVGAVLLGLMAIRARLVPRAAAGLYVLGAALVVPPPPPWGVMPYWGIELGAALFAAGTVWLSAAVWRGAGAVVPSQRSPVGSPITA